MMKRPETLPDFMHYILEARAVSERDLARAAGFHYTSIQHIKKGRYRYPFEALKALYAILTIEEKELLREIMHRQLDDDLEV